MQVDPQYMAGTMTKPTSTRIDYWQKRQTLIYYQYVSLIVRAVAGNATSAIDVGSSNTSIIESFDWIPDKYALDKRNPYSSDTVVGIKQDFFQFDPPKKYDLALCLQVLEHISDVALFAQKLFTIADAVLISVPFQWPKGGCKFHIHDPVDAAKLQSWTNRKPDYHIVVRELFTYSKNSRRLIAYYHPVNQRFSLLDARENLKGGALES